jgi:hypothetical protein
VHALYIADAAQKPRGGENQRTGLPKLRRKPATPGIETATSCLLFKGDDLALTDPTAAA